MIPNKYEIKKADTEDLNELTELGKKLCLEMRSIDPPGMDLKKGFKKEIRKWQASCIVKKKFLFLKAVMGGKIVGYLLCEVQDRLPIFKSDPGHIHDVYILTGYRGKGIGSALISEAVRWFREKGVKRVTIDSLAKNPGATRMYERMNFIGYRMKLGLKI